MHVCITGVSVVARRLRFPPFGCEQMDQNQDPATLAFIRHVLRETGLSPSALAKLAGIASTTLTRPLNKTEHKFNLSATTIEKISKVTGIGAGPFFENKDFASVSIASLFDPRAYDREKWPGEYVPARDALIVGPAGFGLWQEVGHAQREFYGTLMLSHPYYKPEDTFAVFVNDNHAEALAYRQDLLFCVRWGAKQTNARDVLSARNGGYVLLERRRDGGRLFEMTVRRLQEVKAGWQLSLPPRARINDATVTIPELPGDDDARVVAHILYVVRYAID